MFSKILRAKYNRDQITTSGTSSHWRSNSRCRSRYNCCRVISCQSQQTIIPKQKQQNNPCQVSNTQPSPVCETAKNFPADIPVIIYQDKLSVSGTITGFTSLCVSSTSAGTALFFTPHLKLESQSYNKTPVKM